MTTVTGKVRQSIFEDIRRTRLSSIDASSVVGAWRYFTSSPTASEKGRQITGNIQRLDVTKSLSQRSFWTVSKNHSQARTADCPDDRDHDDVDVGVDRSVGPDRDVGLIAFGARPGDQFEACRRVACGLGHTTLRRAAGRPQATTWGSLLGRPHAFSVLEADVTTCWDYADDAMMPPPV